MSFNIRLLLSTMMFLQYFVWGAWWVTLGTYMNASGFDDMIGSTYASQGYAAILTPILVGAFADRYFRAERLMGVLHLAGGGLLLWLAQVHGDKGLFFIIVLVYMFCYMPTLALSNTVAFNSMEDTQKQFPAVRVLGTIGWIVAGLIIGSLQAEKTNTPIMMAGGASLLLGVFSFFLPATPPGARHERFSLLNVTGLSVISLMKERSFAVFIICSLLICIPLSFYYAYTNTFLVESHVELTAGGQTFGPAAIQTIGQMSEIFFMLLLPVFLIWLGFKWVLIVGMLAWAVRYVLFAYGVEDGDYIMWMMLTGIALHGICYDFFFVTGQIYVDKRSDADIRARAQSFLALVTLGIGTVIGTNLSNWIYVQNTISDTEHVWRTIWLIPAAFAAVVLVLFAVLFRERRA